MAIPKILLQLSSIFDYDHEYDNYSKLEDGFKGSDYDDYSDIIAIQGNTGLT